MDTQLYPHYIVKGASVPAWILRNGYLRTHTYMHHTHTYRQLGHCISGLTSSVRTSVCQLNAKDELDGGGSN